MGEISGHSSVINSVSIRQQRPLRAATGADDSSVVFLHGAPFKFETKLGGLHKGYVNGVAFSYVISRSNHSRVLGDVGVTHGIYCRNSVSQGVITHERRLALVIHIF